MFMSATKRAMDVLAASKAIPGSEASFRTLVETVATPIFIICGGALQYVNQAAEAVTGYLQEELFLMNFWDLVSPEDREPAGLPLQREVRIITKNDEERWLEISGYRLHFTEWNSSPLVRSATRRGKQRRLLTPTTFSLLHAADFADRCERQIMPLLQGDYLVLADRYIYTAFARDAARGCPARWLRNLYRFAPIPDITFYFRAPLDVAVNRILSGRPKLKYYEAGMDLGLSFDRSESFRLFQARILDEYDKMVDSDNFVVLDGTIPVNKLQKQMRDIVASKIELKRFAPRIPDTE